MANPALNIPTEYLQRLELIHLNYPDDPIIIQPVLPNDLLTEHPLWKFVCLICNSQMDILPTGWLNVTNHINDKYHKTNKVRGMPIAENEAQPLEDEMNATQAPGDATNFSYSIVMPLTPTPTDSMFSILNHAPPTPTPDPTTATLFQENVLDPRKRTLEPDSSSGIPFDSTKRQRTLQTNFIHIASAPQNTPVFSPQAISFDPLEAIVAQVAREHEEHQQSGSVASDGAAEYQFLPATVQQSYPSTQYADFQTNQLYTAYPPNAYSPSPQYAAQPPLPGFCSQCGAWHGTQDILCLTCAWISPAWSADWVSTVNALVQTTGLDTTAVGPDGFGAAQEVTTEIVSSPELCGEVGKGDGDPDGNRDIVDGNHEEVDGQQKGKEKTRSSLDSEDEECDVIDLTDLGDNGDKGKRKEQAEVVSFFATGESSNMGGIAVDKGKRRAGDVTNSYMVDASFIKAEPKQEISDDLKNYYTTPDDYTPLVSTPSNFLTLASTPSNFLPLASTSSNSFPLASTPSNFLPLASPSNFLPLASTPSNFLPLASTPSNFLPLASISSNFLSLDPLPHNVLATPLLPAAIPPDTTADMTSAELTALISTIPLDDRAADDASAVHTAATKIGATLDGMIDGLQCRLMPHQVVGTAWMCEMEEEGKGGCRGGIMADDMGLGKTIQTIATIVHNQPSRYAKTCHATLVVVPKALLYQWKREIETRVEHGVFSVYVHYGTTRLRTAKEFKQHDIVITTYGTLTNEFPDRIDEDAEVGELLKGMGPLFNVKWLRVVLDEAHLIKNSSTRTSKAAAFINGERRWCLTGTPIQNKIDELYAYFRFLRLKFYRNWPNFRDGIVKPLIRDKEGTLRKVQTILRGVLLRRTKFSILDGRPILALPPRTVDYERGDFLSRERALYTTLEERSQDKFRRAMRAGRVMRRYVFFLTLLLRMRQACDHPALVPKELWEEGEGENEEDLMVGDVKEAEAELEKARRVFPKEVVDRLLVKYGGMRMGMVDREPGKERERGGQAVVNEEQEPLAGEEAEEGDGECPICFDAADSPVVTRCGHMYCKDCILNVIYTDRQVDVVDVEDRRCPLCRGVIKEDELIPLAAFQPPRVVAPVEQPEEINDYDYDDDDDEEELPSLESLLPKPKPEAGAETDAGPSTAGPSTAGPSTTGPSTAPKKSMIERDLWDPLVSSTKIEMLMEMLSQGSAEDPGCKTIVFSQFTKMLDIVEHYLRDKAIKFCRYDGKMTARDQEAAVRQLTDDPRTTVMLGSLKCAGLGLNLTIANRVIIIDPWWNPACEDQAIDRVHRIGQEKGVIVKRLTIKDTVEDRMIALQEKKRELAASALGEGEIRVGRLTLQDLMFLFNVNRRVGV